MKSPKAGMYVPITPGGSVCMWLVADTEEEAIANLLKDAAHMPYDGWDSKTGMGFKQRGYEIVKLEDPE
jgi:hypothetical protein